MKLSILILLSLVGCANPVEPVYYVAEPASDLACVACDNPTDWVCLCAYDKCEAETYSGSRTGDYYACLYTESLCHANGLSDCDRHCKPVR